MNTTVNPSAVDTTTRLACASQAALFQHPLLEDAPASLSATARQEQTILVNRAKALCAKCPAGRRCLYDAVVRYDVAGIVAGTTPAQRHTIRHRLGWQVETESFDTLLGTVTGQHVEHDDVVRAHRASPAEPLAQLAQRLGCSLSTVKRHLRQERLEQRPSLRALPPSPEQVDQARRDVLSDARTVAQRPMAVAA